MRTLFSLVCTLAAAVSGELPFDPHAIVEQVNSTRGESPQAFVQDTVGFMLDTVPIGLTRTADPVLTPAVASNGTDYLVVWKQALYPDNRVYCARVSATGQLLDPGGVIIRTFTQSGAARCAVAWGDTSYLVLWGYATNYVPKIGGALVSANGRVNPGGIVIADDLQRHYNPAVAYDGTKFIVAWNASPDGRRWDIRATPVSTTGQVRYPNGLRIHHGLSLLHANQLAAVAALPNGSLVAWESKWTGQWDILGTVLDSAGVPLDTMPIIIAGEGGDARVPVVATNGENFLAVWRAGEGALADILAARVSPDGVVLDRRPIAVCTYSHAQENPAVAFDGANYAVTWQDWRDGNPDIYGARVTPSGVVLDPGGSAWTRKPQTESNPAVAAGAGNWLLVWLDFRWPNDADVFATRISPDGTVLDSAFPVPDTQALVPKFANQSRPSLAFDGENYLVVWQEDRDVGTGEDIRGMRVSGSGGLLDSVPLLISAAAAEQGYADVAWGDSCYLVVWRDLRVSGGYGSEIFGTRVTRDGDVLDGNGIWLSPGTSVGEHGPAVAFDGTYFYVAWYRETGGNLRHLDAAWVAQGGAIHRRGVGISGEGYKPDIVYADSGLGLLTWIDQRWNSGYANEIYAGRIAPDRTYPDPEGLDLTPAHFYEGPPAVASDGRDFLVVFEQTSLAAIYGVPVSREGGVGDAMILSASGSPAKPEPAVAYGSPRYLAVWPEGRLLKGVWYDPVSGAVESLGIAEADDVTANPGVCSGGSSRFMAVYSARADSVNHRPCGRNRIWGRLLHDDGRPAPPGLVWPPHNHSIPELPVVLLVDSLRPALDSFDFRVMLGGDTLWRYCSEAPRCTVPDDVIVPGATHRWTCRVFDDSLWSRFSVAWQFAYLPTGLEEGPPGGLPVLAGASVLRRGQALTCAGSGGPGLLRLEVFGTDGRRVAVVEPGAGGGPGWDWRDASGRPVAAGVYFVRLTDAAGGLAERKSVLLD
ncbi:MAG: hypothetical protein R6X12_01490 [bacterium]